MRAFTLDQVVSSLMPKTLSDLTRNSKGNVKIYLSSPEEVAKLTATFKVECLTGNFERWSIISIHLPALNTTQLFLVGHSQEFDKSLMTSEIVGIDGDTVHTRSGSYYRLVGERSDNPDVSNILATLDGWGLGTCFGLPPSFF
ncbi:MAG TPA: hypothetical protein VGK09_02435 [Rhodocyclaceae bacterium]|jgi:hypothetical protein